MNFTTLTTYALLITSIFFAPTIEARKHIHNNFRVTNKTTGTITVKLRLKISSDSHLQSLDKRAKTTMSKKINAGQTVNMPFYKGLSLSEVNIIYSDKTVRAKKDFAYKNVTRNKNHQKNSFVQGGTLTIYDDHAEITTQKNGVLLKF